MCKALNASYDKCFGQYTYLCYHDSWVLITVYYSREQTQFYSLLSLWILKMYVIIIVFIKTLRACIIMGGFRKLNLVHFESICQNVNPLQGLICKGHLSFSYLLLLQLQMKRICASFNTFEMFLKGAGRITYQYRCRYQLHKNMPVYNCMQNT